MPPHRTIVRGPEEFTAVKDFVRKPTGRAMTKGIHPGDLLEQPPETQKRTGDLIPPVLKIGRFVPQ
jgi:hypothetical protein